MPGFRADDSVRSWGRVLRGPHRVARPQFPDELPALVDGTTGSGSRLPVGLRRSYGDSCLNPGGGLILMEGLDRIHYFDRENGILRADAGMSLDQLIRVVLPHGWFPAVVPGTRFVTLGGAIANDVHGKNHHREGTFGAHVRRLRLLRTDGTSRELAPDDPTGLFAATIGGLGLTGTIEWVEIALKPVPGAWLDSEDVAFGSLAEFFSLAAESEASHAYTVAWVDCTSKGDALGRGIFSRANLAQRQDRPLHVSAPRLGIPIDFPRLALNPLTLKAFNQVYFHGKRLRAGRGDVHYAPFFFPLDVIDRWNRLYGSAGMYQYQCVVPEESAHDAIAELLDNIAKSGEGSFLAVLKTFGDKPSPGLLSFPRKGATLALDFRNRGSATLGLMNRLDAIVRAANGRLYPAKDGRMPPAMFAAGFPALDAFSRHIDPGLSSAFWKRVQP